MAKARFASRAVTYANDGKTTGMPMGMSTRDDDNLGIHLTALETNGSEQDEIDWECE